MNYSPRKLPASSSNFYSSSARNNYNRSIRDNSMLNHHYYGGSGGGGGGGGGGGVRASNLHRSLSGCNSDTEITTNGINWLDNEPGGGNKMATYNYNYPSHHHYHHQQVVPPPPHHAHAHHHPHQHHQLQQSHRWRVGGRRSLSSYSSGEEDSYSISNFPVHYDHSKDVLFDYCTNSSGNNVHTPRQNVMKESVYYEPSYFSDQSYYSTSNNPATVTSAATLRYQTPRHHSYGAASGAGGPLLPSSTNFSEKHAQLARDAIKKQQLLRAKSASYSLVNTSSIQQQQQQQHHHQISNLNTITSSNNDNSNNNNQQPNLNNALSVKEWEIAQFTAKIDVNEFRHIGTEHTDGLLGLLSRRSLAGTASYPSATTPSATPLPTNSTGFSGLLVTHIIAGVGLNSSQNVIRDLYCVLETDALRKARSMIRTSTECFEWDEIFEIDIMNNTCLSFLFYQWDPRLRHRLCFYGNVTLEPLLARWRMNMLNREKLVLQLEPKGLLYFEIQYLTISDIFTRTIHTPSSSSLRGTMTMIASLSDGVGANQNSRSVFGVPLKEIILMESNATMIPLIVRSCVEEVDFRGLDVVGIYRLSGSIKLKVQLKQMFDQSGNRINISAEAVPDIHAITSVLKDFLRELPEPLFTDAFYQMIVDAYQLQQTNPENDPSGTQRLMLNILDCLPGENQNLIFYLMDHLLRVIGNCEVNKTDTRTLSHVFGPLLFYPSPRASHKFDMVILNPMLQAEIFEFIIGIWPHEINVNNRSARSSRDKSITNRKSRREASLSRQQATAAARNSSKVSGVGAPYDQYQELDNRAMATRRSTTQMTGSANNTGSRNRSTSRHNSRHRDPSRHQTTAGTGTLRGRSKSRDRHHQQQQQQHKSSSETHEVVVSADYYVDDEDGSSHGHHHQHHNQPPPPHQHHQTGTANNSIRSNRSHSNRRNRSQSRGRHQAHSTSQQPQTQPSQTHHPIRSNNQLSSRSNPAAANQVDFEFNNNNNNSNYNNSTTTPIIRQPSQNHPPHTRNHHHHRNTSNTINQLPY